MTKDEIYGVVNQDNLGRKTDYLFRLSMKALIRNDKNEVLVVKEAKRTWWDLPGGGMDHEEGLREAIARELHEEVRFTGDFTYKVIAVEDPSLLQHAKVWQVRIVFAVEPVNMMFSAGDDAAEVLFIDPETLKESDSITERKVYEYSLLVGK